MYIWNMYIYIMHDVLLCCLPMLCVYVDATTGFLQEVCDTVLACLLVFCLEILVKEVSHNGRSILSLYMCTTAAAYTVPTSIVHLLSNGQYYVLVAGKYPTLPCISTAYLHVCICVILILSS